MSGMDLAAGRSAIRTRRRRRMAPQCSEVSEFSRAGEL